MWTLVRRGYQTLYLPVLELMTLSTHEAVALGVIKQVDGEKAKMTPLRVSTPTTRQAMPTMVIHAAIFVRPFISVQLFK